jgi:hypothetical protein
VIDRTEGISRVTATPANYIISSTQLPSYKLLGKDSHWLSLDLAARPLPGIMAAHLFTLISIEIIIEKAAR